MKGFLTLCLLCILVMPVAAKRWVGYTTSIAVVYVHPGEEGVATRLGTMAAEETARLMQPLGLRAVSQFPIYAYTNRTEFLRATSPTAGLLGVSYRPSGMIRLDATGTQGPVRQTLAHELVHTLLTQRLGANYGSLPIWVNEGVAGFLSVPRSQSEAQGIAHARHPHGLLPPNEMDAAFASHGSVDVAYAQSESMIAWLEVQYPGATTRLVDHLARGEDFDHALDAACRLTVDAWYEKWLHGLSNFETLVNLLASPVVYAPMALLILVTALLKMLRRDREEEEEEEDARPHHTPTPSARRPVTQWSTQLAQSPIWDDIHTP